MTSIAKLKDKARKSEQKEDWQAAIEVYQKVLVQQEEDEDLELDLSLYNRIGDLNLRLGQTDEAVSYYETAADKYAESGFYNNAIALCNKALRHRPDRPAIYLKLSRLCNEQGFQTDARRWILEYAERSVAAGEVEAALTGLEEFADLSDDPEVRELLAQQLASNEREDEAIAQLRTAYGMRARAGQTEKAAEVAERARAIDPGVDLESEAPEPAPEPEPAEFEADAVPELGEEAPEDAGVGAGMEAPTAEVEAGAEADDLEGLEARAEATADDVEAAGLEGIESHAADVEAEATEAGEVSGLEVSFSEQAPPAAPEEAEAEELGGLETFGPGPDTEAPDEEDEEAEPLPMLDTGFEEEQAPEEAAEAAEAGAADEAPEDAEEEAGEEEAEPLPMLDTGFEEEPEEEAEEEPGEEPGEEPEELVAAEGADEDAGGLDLGFDEAAVAEETEEAEPAPAGAAAEPSDEAMDLGSFDLGFESSEEGAPEVAAEDLDIDAIIQRSRELVSRGLTGEALRELNLLSGSDAGPEVFKDALGVVNEIIRHDENDISALQRRVEYGARIGDRELLIEAYLDLSEALDRLGAETKARAMYERVLDLDPENAEAREALGEAEEEEEDAVDLDAILREMEPEEEAAAARAGEQASDPNFAAMLNQFKAKVTENVEPDDAGDHYDLGLAFKEMGLIDEAIAEFQTALTGGTERLKVYEELGQCFVQKSQYNVALKVFKRALKVPHTDDDELLGVYYHMGQCHEELGQRQEAREAYEKVLAIDEEFADVPDRMARL